MTKFRFAIAALPLAILAGCGDGAGNVTAPAGSVANVAAPAGTNWVETVAVSPEGGYVMGNPNAAIKLVEYGSRTCPACGAFAREATRPLVENYVATGKVSFEFRDFLIHGASDLALAALGRCNGTEPFFPLLEQTYENQDQLLTALQGMSPEVQQRLQSLPPGQALVAMSEAAGLIDFFKQRGISDARARQCLSDTAALDQLTKQTQETASQGEVTGTPSFFINGEKVEGVSWGQLEPLLKNAGA